MSGRPGRLLLRADRVFDGRGTVRGSDVLVEGARIAAVGARLGGHADVLDLRGCTLLPGLVDTHVHLAFDASPDVVGALAGRDDAAALDAMRLAAHTAVRGGVTTVRDLGDRDYLALSLRDTPGLPTILAAGPPLTLPGGHCHYLGGVVEPGADGIRAGVRERADRGVDVVKVMASGGTLTPGTHQHQPQFTAGELRAAVEEAHRLGLPVTAHAHAVDAIRNALDAGVDGIEHVTFWTEDGVHAPPGLLARLATSGITLGATVGLAPLAGAAPPPAVAARMPHIVANGRALHEAGARIVAGTDAGIGPVKPHDVARHAVGQLVTHLGIDPAAALRRMTSDAAGALGLGATKGRIAPGYDADLLAVRGDPCTDPAALHEIRAVFARGVRVR